MNKIDKIDKGAASKQMKNLEQYRFAMNQNYFFIYNKKNIFYYELDVKSAPVKTAATVDTLAGNQIGDQKFDS